MHFMLKTGMLSASYLTRKNPTGKLEVGCFHCSFIRVGNIMLVIFIYNMIVRNVAVIYINLLIYTVVFNFIYNVRMYQSTCIVSFK